MAKSDLGKRLRELRAQYIAKGGKLLTLDEVRHEAAKRRGESRGPDDVRVERVERVLDAGESGINNGVKQKGVDDVHRILSGNGSIG